MEISAAAQVFGTALLTGPSVRAEAGQNASAGTFTFRSHAPPPVKENSRETLSGHRQRFNHRWEEIN